MDLFLGNDLIIVKQGAISSTKKNWVGMMLGRNVRGMEHLSLEIACLNLKIGKTILYLHSI